MDLEKIKTRFKDSGSVTKSDADKKFNSTVKSAADLVLSVVNNFKGKGSKQLHEIAKRNFIINLVSSLEVYLRNLVIEKNCWKKSGFDNLLRDKISLNEAFKLFKKFKVTRRFIIAQHFSFQSIESINFVFSNLTGVSDFLNEIENYKYDADQKTETLIELYPNWRKGVVMLFDLRNKIVHEGYDSSIDESEIDEYYEAVTEFQLIIVLYCVEIENEYLKRKLAKFQK